MPYQYGMQTSPSGGNGLGGLPKKQTTPKTVNFTRVLGAASFTSGTIIPPANANYMRVAAIGAGGTSAFNDNGGGGGGCAASKIVPAAPIVYEISGTSGSPSDGTIAIFPGYRLLGGKDNTRSGGTASGGDYNYSGGAGGGTGQGGGGAAGPYGPGQSAASAGTQLQLGSQGWGVGGGAAGRNTRGGSGTGEAFSASGITASGATPWGRPSSNGYIGGELGGGGSGDTIQNYAGGVGGIVVEYFYD